MTLRANKSVYLPVWMWEGIEKETKELKYKSYSMFIEKSLTDILRKENPLKQCLRLLEVNRKLLEVDEKKEQVTMKGKSIRKEDMLKNLKRIEELIFEI